MIVYVCMGGDYEGDWITAVFATHAEAEQHLRDYAHASAQMRPTRIEEYVVGRVDPAWAGGLDKLPLQIG